MRPSQLGTLLCLLSLFGCSSSKVQTAPAELRIEPETLSFPTTYLGATSTHDLTLQNIGRRAFEAHLSVAAPFHVQPSASLDVGARQALQVSFEPTAAGLFSLPLTVEWEGHTQQVLLTAEAKAPLECPSTTPCQQSHFDPVTGTCVTEATPAGADCQTVCIEHGTCQRGVCMGPPRSCDDGDICTHDSCTEKAGCQHTPTTENCPSSTDACQVATCSKDQGCGFAPAPDLTSCGGEECTPKVCVQGQCQESTLADGTECHPTPCSDGICQSGACQKTADDVLMPVWENRPPEGRGIFFTGITDDQGNTYWFEYPSGNFEGWYWQLVSADSQGRVRYREAFDPDQFNQFSYAPDGFFARGRLYISYRGLVQARDPSSGRVDWSLDFAELTINDTTAHGLDERGLVTIINWNKQNSVIASFGQNTKTPDPNNNTPTPTISYIASISMDSGNIRWIKQFQATSAAPILTGDDGSIYFNDNARHILSWSIDGRERWRRDEPPDETERLVGLSGDNLLLMENYHSSLRLLETQSGRDITPAWINSASLCRAGDYLHYLTFTQGTITESGNMWPVPIASKYAGRCSVLDDRLSSAFTVPQFMTPFAVRWHLETTTSTHLFYRSDTQSDTGIFETDGIGNIIYDCPMADYYTCENPLPTPTLANDRFPVAPTANGLLVMKLQNESFYPNSPDYARLRAFRLQGIVSRDQGR